MQLNEISGCLLIDEIKLSEALWYDKEILKVNGFVNLDQFTPEGQKDIPADHALVIMFQGFQGQYFQTISAHLTKGAVKGPELSKLVLEAVRLVEEPGFFVDAIVADAAPWNRNMWSQFGLKKFNYEREQSKKRYTVDDPDEENIDDDGLLEFEKAYASNRKKKTSKKPSKSKRKRRPTTLPTVDDETCSIASCVHPVDSKRRLWFFSDFPHLVKSMKQRIVNAEVLEVSDKIDLLNFD